MIVRIILLILLFKYHRQIYQFLLDKNVFSFAGIQKKVEGGVNRAQKYLTRHKLEKTMLDLKNIDKSTYREVKKRLLNIDKMFTDASQHDDISLRNTYENIKEQKKYIKNRISSLAVQIGRLEDPQGMIRVIEKHINDIIKNILDMRDRRGINTEWFEGIWYDPVVPNDTQTNINYDFFTH
tara:strand:+ start:449 stop:991 length:543 start_codon:yes stop_codon:yes gene_type:complete